LVVRRKADKANDSAVPTPVDDSELTEVFVDRDQHGTIGSGAFENLIIARITRPRSRPVDLMSTGGE
jgi:hypothetical protein